MKFYWKGEQLTGTSFGKGLSVDDLLQANINEQRKCNWNKADNWFIKVAGPTAGATLGTGGIFLGNDDFHFVAATQSPGGGDNAIFEKFTYNSLEYPASPCLYGGFWGDEGWLNASVTGGQCSVLIEENYGDADNVVGTSEGPASGQIGIGLSDRNVLVTTNPTLQPMYDYGISGASMSGLRLNANRILNKANYDFEFYAVDTDCVNYTSYASLCTSRFDGGDWAQIDINSQDAPSSGPGSFGKCRTFFEMADDYWTGASANITQFAIVQRVTSDLLTASQSKVSLRSTTSIPNLVVVPSIRPEKFLIDANITTATIYPESRRTYSQLFNLGAGYNTVVFGNFVSGLTVQNIKLRDEAPGVSGSDILTELDWLSQGASLGQDVVGANNLVGINADLTVNNLEIGAGRVVLGNRTRYLSGAAGVSAARETCDLEQDDQVLIEGGLIGSNGMLDLTNPIDQTYKGAKVGPGVSHPSEGEGMQIIGDEANIRYPRDMFFVADYRDGQTGASFDIFELYPEVSIGRLKG